MRLKLRPDCPRDARFHVLSALFLLALGLASTNIFLLSRPVVYHEAIMWSVSLAFGAVACAFDYLCSGHLRWLVGAHFLAMLSLNARPVAGAAALAACGLVPVLRLLSPRNDSGEPSALRTGVRHVLIGRILAVLSLGCCLAVIHGGFRHVRTDTAPVQLGIRCRALGGDRRLDVSLVQELRLERAKRFWDGRHCAPNSVANVVAAG